MEHPGTTINGIIERLGGLSSAARRLGVTATVVDNWRSRGRIPPHYYFAVLAALKKKRAAAPPIELFGFYVPPAVDNPHRN